MYIDFDNVGPRLTLEDILEKVSEEAIYKKFCSKFPSKLFHSPFRTDKNPSFGFYKKGARWFWKDQGSGEHGGVVDFVQMDQKTDFKGALEIIAKEFFITTGYRTNIIESRTFNNAAVDKAEQKQRSLIQVIRRPYTADEYKWWHRILIDKKMLEFYFMRAAQEVWVNKKLFWFNKDDNPIYYYLSPISQNVKCYRPLEKDKKRKWLSNQDPLRDIQGYWQCNIKAAPRRPLLLVKSLKEVAFMRVFGFNAMANTAEHTHYHPDFIRHIRKYCWPILYLGDNDWPGRRAVIKLWHGHRTFPGYNIPGLIIPQHWGAKDPTDLWLHDYRKVYDLLNLIYAYFETIRNAGEGAVFTRGLYRA